LGAGIQGLRNLPVFGLTTDPHPILTLFLCPYFLGRFGLFFFMMFEI
jgi:hypothetical protein